MTKELSEDSKFQISVKTLIDDGSFVGTNSSLVAPLKIGKKAYVAAGSVITSDVPSGALAFGRAKQATKKNWKKK